MASSPSTRPGYYRGRHFTSYTADVQALKREGDEGQLETLLLHLVGATEAESHMDGTGVAPWYYEELAKLYRKQKEYGREVAVLERYAAQRHAPGALPEILGERLEKARALWSTCPMK